MNRIIKKLSRRKRNSFINKMRHIKRTHYTNNLTKKRTLKLLMFFLFMLIPVVIIYKSLPSDYAAFIDGLLLRIFLFIKSHSLIIWIKASAFAIYNTISSSIVLFFTTLTIKKFTILSIIGLAKRFLIDHVIVKFLYNHFIKDIKDPIKLLFKYVYGNFKSFSIKKKMIGVLSLFLPASIISYSLYSMNLFGFIVEKLFSANMWKLILAFFLKIINSIFYFLSNYLWNSWIAPIIEIILFSFIIGFLEKHVSFIGKPLRLLYKKFENLGNIIIYFMDRYFFRPSKIKMKIGAKHINRKINLFINKNNIKNLSLKEIQQIKSKKISLKIKKLYPEQYKKLQKRRKLK